MQELILKADEEIILQPGEGIRAGAEPLCISVGLIEFFGDKTGSGQQQILTAVADCIRCAVPADWRIETFKHIRLLAEQIADDTLVAIFPTRLEWKRTAKGRQYRLHEIDVLVIGQLDTDSTVDLIDQWAELFLDGGGPTEAACMDAVTLDNADAGYDIDQLTQTPSTFVGGLRLTFWEL